MSADVEQTVSYAGPDVDIAETPEGGHFFCCHTCGAEGPVRSCSRVADGDMDDHFWACPAKVTTEIREPWPW